MTQRFLQTVTFALAAFVLASAALSAQTQTQTTTTQATAKQQPPPPPATKPAAPATAQKPPTTAQKPPATTQKPTTQKPAPPAPPPPVQPNYRIGTDDVLVITVWRTDEASGEVIVRPDGKVTMKMGEEIVALGLTTEEFRKKVEEELKKFFDPVPHVQIQVKEIRSRLVFITGAVGKPGPYPIIGTMNVVQLISVAGGLAEFADKKNVMLISATLKDKNGQPMAYKINYDDLTKGKNLAKNNIELRPGDQVIVR